MHLFSGLPKDTNEKDLLNVFQIFGKVKYVNFLDNNAANVYLVTGLV